GRAAAKRRICARAPARARHGRAERRMSPHGADDGPANAADDRERRRRVFFALWPDADTSGAIVRATRRAVRLSGGAPMARQRLQVTVAFLGGVTPDEREQARGVMPIRVGPFDLSLDTLGVWPHSRTLWLAGRSVPPALNELERRLRSA